MESDGEWILCNLVTLSIKRKKYQLREIYFMICISLILKIFQPFFTQFPLYTHKLKKK